MNIHPHTLGVLILLLIVLFGEVRSYAKGSDYRRMVKENKRRG